MNEEIVLSMIEPYVKNGSITYDEFDMLFYFLSKKEQYSVTNVLAAHGIELRVSEKDYDDLFQADEDVIKKLEEGELPDEESDDEEDLDLSFQLIDFEKPSSKPRSEDDDAADLYYSSEYENEVDETVEDADETDESVESTPYKATPLYALDIFGGNDIRDYELTLGKDIRQSNEMLIKLYHEGHKQALEDLCVKNQKLVLKYAIKYAYHNGSDLSADDLFFAGVIGLIRAATKFKLGLGYTFSTYAVYWIKQMIFREIADHGFTIRIPVHMYERILKVARLEGDYYDQGLSIQERIEAIVKVLGDANTPLTEQQVAECIRLREQLLHCTSLDTPVGEDGESLLGDFLPDKRKESSEAFLHRMSLRSELLEFVKELNPKEQSIINDRFGLYGQGTKTLEQIGSEMNVTRERIRQIEAKALKKLEKKCAKAGLADYLEEMATWT